MATTDTAPAETRDIDDDTGDTLTLTLTTRDQMVAFLAGPWVHAYTPDPGSDLVVVRTPATSTVVMLGDTVTRVDDEFVVTERAGKERTRFRFREYDAPAGR